MCFRLTAYKAMNKAEKNPENKRAILTNRFQPIKIGATNRNPT